MGLDGTENTCMIYIYTHVPAGSPWSGRSPQAQPTRHSYTHTHPHTYTNIYMHTYTHINTHIYTPIYTHRRTCKKSLKRGITPSAANSSLSIWFMSSCPRSAVCCVYVCMCAERKRRCVSVFGCVRLSGSGVDVNVRARQGLCNILSSNRADHLEKSRLSKM